MARASRRLRPARLGKTETGSNSSDSTLWLASRGAPKIELMVRDGNDRAEKFYEALGFERQDVKVYGKWLKVPDAAESRKAS